MLITALILTTELLYFGQCGHIYFGWDTEEGMKFQPVNHGNDIIVYPSEPLQRVLGATAERLESLQTEYNAQWSQEEWFKGGVVGIEGAISWSWKTTVVGLRIAHPWDEVCPWLYTA